MKKILLFLVALALIVPNESMAFGKKRKKPTPPPSETQAYPLRVLALGNVLNPTFKLPTGQAADLNLEMREMIVDETLNVTKRFTFKGPQPATPQDRFIFEGGIVAFEAKNTEFGVTVGFKPTGDIGSGVLTGAEGALTFSVGLLVMDYHIIDTQTNQVVATGTGNALPNNTALTVKLDFGPVGVGTSFLKHSGLYGVFSKALHKALRDMENDPCTNYDMDWTTSVASIDLNLKRVFFNAGEVNRIVPTNLFDIYDSERKLLGTINTREVWYDLSWGDYKNDGSGKALNNTKPGDLVRLHRMGVCR